MSATQAVTAHTSELDAGTLQTARTLVEESFTVEYSGADWEHGLGGMHALVWEEGELVAHGSVVQRRLLHEGRALRTGYVEGVAV
ncbi:aminoglycoside 2'-N-acetyltransferase, partial [Streptomyces sp. OF3]|nr:aminoglycoside 2'-N-acetyltransferase [Streptomyces alkaliterrae]